MKESTVYGNPDGTYAKVIADSITWNGRRLTTMEVQCHRFVLAEFNTHRAFTRNSASSRAIPVRKQIDRIQSNPAVPLRFPEEQKGMQGAEEEATATMNGMNAKEHWLEACNNAVRSANSLVAIGVHKSVVNRLLEPFMWHRIIVSATEWQNFFAQRVSPLAQPEIRAVAVCMRDALNASDPFQIPRGMHGEGFWHLPYIESEDWEVVRREQIKDLSNLGKSMYPIMCKISAARCARVSYLTHDGKRDWQEDVTLYDLLTAAEPPHWSPLEHVATPRQSHLPAVGNFEGWYQLRHFVENG